jgi:hypothetical protein
MDTSFCSLGRETNVINIFAGNPEGREYLGDLRVDGEDIIEVQN